MMRFEYDEEADAAYVYFVYPIKDGEAKKTVQVKEGVHLDFDAKGKLLGIEILDASKRLSKQTLLAAQHA